MLLTRDSIKKEIAEGRIKIEPPVPDEYIQVASIDLRLGNVFRVFQKAKDVLDVTECTDYKAVTKEVIQDAILLSPGETILGITYEKITLPDNICGWLEGRSRFARLGLLIHISAGLIQPGVSNHQVLEITNLGPSVLKLHAGERICQLAFQRCEGNAQYAGKFQGQRKP
ncbi:MAG: dCTP deaminase [Patescibacteria group bacterium]|nr:dCTP deaminase [Patescibacteria group bacterium]